MIPFLRAYAGKQSPQRGDSDYDYFFNALTQQAGLPAHAAHGALAGAYSESRLDPTINEVSPTVPGSRGGFGVNQWTGPRRAALENYAAQHNLSVGSREAQAQFWVNELLGSESAARDALLRTSTPAEAARVYTNKFLRPGIDHSGRSAAMATKFAAGEHPPATSFARRQAAEVSDIQTDFQNMREEANTFENNMATMYANPNEIAKMAKMEPFSPFGGSTVQGTPHDPYGQASVAGGAVNDTLDMGVPAGAPIGNPATPIPLPEPGTLGLPGDAPLVGQPPLPTEPLSAPWQTNYVPPAPPTAPASSPRPRAATGRTAPPAASPPEGKKKWFELSPEKVFAGMEALGLGLSQISGGANVNLSPVWNRRNQAAQAAADDARQAMEFEQRQQLAQAQEARLRQKLAVDQAEVVQDQAGRNELADLYVSRTGDERGGEAIRLSPQAATQASQMLFPEGAGKDEAPPSPEAIENAARLAEVTPGYGPDFAAAIRNDPTGTLFKEFMQEAAKRTGGERQTAQVGDPLATADRYRDRAVRARDQGRDEVARVYDDYADRMEDAADIGDQNEINSVAEALGAALQKIQVAEGKSGIAVGEEQAIAEQEAARNERTAAFITAKGPEYAAAAEMARVNPKAGMDMMVEQDTLKAADREDAQAKAHSDALAGQFEQLAETSGDPETKQQYETMALAVRSGNTKEAMSQYRQMTEDKRPSEQRLAEWLAASPDATADDIMEARRTLAGTDRVSMVNKVMFEELQKDREAVLSSRVVADAFQQADTMAKQPDFNTGMLQELLLPYKAAVKDLGFTYNLGGDIDDQQFFQSLMSGIIQYKRVPGTGHMSDWDGEKIEESIASIRKGEYANRAIIQYNLRTLALQEASVDARTEYFVNGGDLSDAQAVKQYVKDYQSKLGLHTDAFYDLGDGDSVPKRARALEDQGLLKDGDMILVEGQMVPYNSRILE